MLKQDCGVKVKTTATRNPQANSAVERMHQTVGNMICMFQVCDDDSLDDEDPWAGILTAVVAAVCCTCNATMHATPVQLVFGHDFNMNAKFAADWDCIRARKQERINDNDARENRKENEISGIICCCNKFNPEAATLAFQVLFFADAPCAPNINAKLMHSGGPPCQ